MSTGAYAQITSGAQTSSSGTPGAVIVLAESAIPMVRAPSGTMGNNGAMTFGTALTSTFYPNAYVFLPAGAISSGSAAGWYYTTFSSTTLATVFNNTYTSGVPVIPASPTAFSTTGPGAFTGTITDVFPFQFTVPANTLGVNGTLTIDSTYASHVSGTTRSATVNFGGTAVRGLSMSTSLNVYNDRFSVHNAGRTDRQYTSPANEFDPTYGGQGGSFVSLTTLDTTTNLVLQVDLSGGVAADWNVLTNLVLTFVPGV